MGRRTNDAALSSPASRAKLQARGKPHYRALEPGLHLGYRRTRGKPGTWMARFYCGEQQYQVEAIAHPTSYGTAPCIADDASPADGVRVLSYAQAIERARARASERANEAAGIAKLATVATALDTYLDWREEHGKSGQDARQRAHARIYPQLGDVPLADLTTDKLHEWLAALANAPKRRRTAAGEKQRHIKLDCNDEEAVRRRRATANRTWTVLRAALNHAFRTGKIASDAPWRKLKPFKGVDAARVHYLSVDEAQRFLAACDPAEFRPLVQAALTTGARYGELCRLQVSDFNATAGTIHVRQSKSGKARHVVLNTEGAAFFAALCAGRPGQELMLRHTNGEPWRRNNQQQPTAQACARAGIVPPISFHILRHTWASLSVMSGMPLMVVARNLGHASTNMVEKHYGHMSPSYIADEIRRGAPTFGFAS